MGVKIEVEPDGLNPDARLLVDAERAAKIKVAFGADRPAADLDAPEEQLAKLVRLTERYCVVYQTLRQAPAITIAHRVTAVS